MNYLKFKHIILISIDATSPERLSCYGYKRTTTPQIEKALSRGGVVSKNAFSQAPYTETSHSSMLTSLYLLSHRVTDWTTRLNAELTLASVFNKNGFATAGFTSHSCLSKKFGYATGFDTFARSWAIGKIAIKRDGVILGKTLKHLVTRGTKKLLHIPRKRGKFEISCEYGLNWIEINKTRPFFLFVHLLSAHPHYNAPRPFGGLFLKEVPDKFKDIRISKKQWGYVQDLRRYSEQEKIQLIELLGRMHDEEIAYNDGQIGAVIATLKRLNIHKDTLIIITSDHGNFLPTASKREEEGCLFDNNLHVPLIFINPELEPNRDMECLAQVIDIFPTALSFAGIDIPAIAQGKDLKETVLSRTPGPHQYIFANHVCGAVNLSNSRSDYTGPKAIYTAVRSKEWKFIYEEKTGRTQLYDLTRDPKELNNLTGKLPEKIEVFFKKYREWKEQTLKYELDAEEKPLSKAEAKQLRALGYID